MHAPRYELACITLCFLCTSFDTSRKGINWEVVESILVASIFLVSVGEKTQWRTVKSQQSLPCHQVQWYPTCDFLFAKQLQTHHTTEQRALVCFPMGQKSCFCVSVRACLQLEGASDFSEHPPDSFLSPKSITAMGRYLQPRYLVSVTM